MVRDQSEHSPVFSLLRYTRLSQSAPAEINQWLDGIVLSSKGNAEKHSMTFTLEPRNNLTVRC